MSETWEVVELRIAQLWAGFPSMRINKGADAGESFLELSVDGGEERPGRMGVRPDALGGWRLPVG
ncbi:MAG: hypothetical protein Kow0092_16750 [Deferrisomatales bacterium]